MYQCEDHGVPCLENDYHRFDNICRSELSISISVNEIINESKYCQSIAIDFTDESKDEEYLDLHDHLAGLKGKFGLYQLWIMIGECQDHEMNSFLCVYTGKGHVKGRLLSHIKTKWPQEEMLYITFYECKNRIAKYLEQLFLDTYDFYLNSEENSGTGELFARWNEERTLLGTEMHSMAEIFGKKYMQDI